MMTPTPAPKRQRSLRTRVMQIVVPVVMGTFVIIGLVLLVITQNQTRNAAIDAQKQDLDRIAQRIDQIMQQAADDLRALAASRSSRDFAQDTLLNVSSTAIAESQSRLLRDMTLMLERQPESFIRVRYITYTGSVWSEVDASTGEFPVADDRIRLNMLRGDLLLEAARVVPTGTVLGGDIGFVRDSTGATLPLIRLATPVSTENDPTNLAGVLELNVLATPVLETLQRAAADSSAVGDGRRYLLVDAQNRVLIDTSSAEIALFNLLTEGRGIMLDESDPALQARLDGASGPLQAVAVGSGKFRLGEVVSSAEIALSSGSAPYFRIFVLASDGSAGAVSLPSVIIMLASLLLGALLNVAIFVVLGRVLSPMQALAEQAARGVPAPAPAGEAPVDEIGQLSSAFAALANETAQLRSQLGEQSERYRRNLAVTARMGRETAAMYDLDALLNRAINLISTEYGFYHAQVFLIDDVGRFAVLVYSTGEAGRELLRRKHKLAVGSESLVGLVASAGQPQMVNDTQEPGDVPWRFNPLLPETRGEMALPLQVGEQVIGVLDVQSRQPGRFDDRDLQTFQLLADQIALAVQNARLVQQTDERVAQIDTLNRQLTREAWRESQQQTALPGYSYDLLSLDTQEAGRQLVPAEPAPALETPIVVRGEVIGTLAAAGEGYSENDRRFMKAVADRVALALENARLFSEAQSGRRTLFTILETLPAGVLVLDALTLRPLQANAEAETLLGQPIIPDVPFSTATYGMRRFGSPELYPDSDLPIFVTASTGNPAMVDDVTVRRAEGDISLVLNTAPIRDSRGGVTAVVAAFQDISVMRTLESSLQSTLQETITLYDTARALAEAEETGDVLDQVIAQLASLDAAEIQVVLLEEDYAGAQVVRSQSGETGEFSLPGELLDAAEPVLVSDTALDGRTALAAALQARGVRSAASLPLMARARREVPLGWLVLLFDTPQPLEDRLTFLSTLSDSAAVAIDNRNLFRSTEDALQQTAAIYSATTAISRAQTLAELGEALRAAAATLQPDVVAAYLLAPGEALVPLLAPAPDAGLDEAIVRFSQGQDRRALFLDDLEQASTPEEHALFAESGLRAVGMTPLRDGGLIFVGYREVHRFSSGDARYLAALADSASVVSSNLNLLEQVQAALQETSVLYEASRALANARTIDEVLAASVQQLQGAPITTAMLVVLLGDAWDAPDVAGRVEAVWQRDGLDLGLSGVTLRPEEFPIWPLLSASQPLLVSDSLEAGLDEMQMLALQTLDLRAVLVLPLRTAARPIGALVLGADESLAFSERDLRIFSAFAEQASIRIEAARLLQQTERRARQLSTNAEVSQITSSILNMGELLPRLVEDVRTSFGYDHVQIFLMDEQDEYAVLRASTGEAGAQLLAQNHRLRKGSRSVIGQVTAQGRAVIAADTAGADVVHRPNPLLPYTRAEMAIPLLVKGKVLGALDVQSNRPNAFDEDDVNVLTALAGQVAIAIDNAELFDASRQTASNMSMLFRVSNAAAAGETLVDSVTDAASILREALDALCVSVYLPERYLDAQDSLIVMMRPVALAGTELPLSEVSEVNLADGAQAISRAVQDGAPLELADLAQQAGGYTPIVASARAVLILPLMSGSEAVGVVVIERREAGAFDADTRAVLLTLRGSLAVVVQNKQLLEQVQRTNSQLLELDRMKSDFLANMSHELRTPLNSIIGFSKVILKGIDGPLTEMQEQDLSTIYTSGVHLLNLINDILDQAKITAGKMDLQLAHFDMKNVVDAVRSIGIGLVKDKPIQILAEMAPGLPRAYGDEFRTRQVMLNLVSNAAKFTREGSITIRAYPVQDAETGRMLVRTDVVDTGIGIADKDLPLLFEAFRQVDSSLTRTVGGTGLGLPIAKSLVEMQNGQILVESHLNVGSTFSILMPTGPQDEPPTAPELELPPQINPMMDTIVLQRPKAKTQELNLGGKRRDTLETDMLSPRALPQMMIIKRQVLLIEDVPEQVDGFRRALQREGYEVFAASIPLEAEAMATGLRPTLIVMSAEFGGGQAGWEILARLKSREDTLDIPVIVVSSDDAADRAQQAGAFAFVRRPFAPDALLQTVQQAEQDSRVERILIVDDQPESVRLLQDILAEQGRYRVFSAASAMEGIAMVARRRPNLIVLDLRMPEMDGFAVIRELRMNPETANIPIVAVTADALSPEEQSLLKNVRVLYKHDLSNGKRGTLLEEVQSHLQQAAGG